jgi:hypothetical protein
LVDEDPGRVEHTLGDYEAPEAVAPQPIVAQRSPQPSAKPQPPLLKFAVLDESIDFIIGLDIPRPVSGEEIAIHAQTSIDPGLRRPVHWEGYDPTRRSWEPIHLQQMYEQVRAGLQLVNRAGPIDENEMAAFMAGMQEIAVALSAQAEVTDVDAASEAALVLDAFCADHDIQIGFSVLGREGHTLAGTKIRALAESNGCILTKDGRFHKLNEHGVPIYSLANAEPMPFHVETLKTLNTRGVGLALDVPRAPGTPATFRSFIEFAKLLAQSLDGVLVDDERKAISDTSIDQIAAQLNAIHQAMAVRGIPAGGAIAQRLFA